MCKQQTTVTQGRVPLPAPAGSKCPHHGSVFPELDFLKFSLSGARVSLVRSVVTTGSVKAPLISSGVFRLGDLLLVSSWGASLRVGPSLHPQSSRV